MRDCEFIGNSGGSGSGAWVEGQSNARFVRCTFDGNVAVGIGGAVATDGAADLVLADCEFHDNIGGSGGGACVSVGTATIEGCSFVGNDADFGGALCFLSAAHVSVRKTTVEASEVSYQGGGIYASDSAFELEDSSVTGCDATIQGGAAWMLTSTAAFSRCSFRDNWSGGYGGGLYSSGTGVVVSASEFVGNGVAIYFQPGSRAPLDARWNWWGHSSGPYNALANPSGAGDEVSNGVSFDPWLVTSSSEELPVAVESTWGAIKSLYR